MDGNTVPKEMTGVEQTNPFHGLKWDMKLNDGETFVTRQVKLILRLTWLSV